MEWKMKWHIVIIRAAVAHTVIVVSALAGILLLAGCQDRAVRDTVAVTPQVIVVKCDRPATGVGTTSIADLPPTLLAEAEEYLSDRGYLN
jgi:uncharacterized lipoprotein YajG